MVGASNYKSGASLCKSSSWLNLGPIWKIWVNVEYTQNHGNSPGLEKTQKDMSILRLKCVLPKKIEQTSNVSKLRESLKTLGFQVSFATQNYTPEVWDGTWKLALEKVRCLNFRGPVSASRRVNFGRIPPSKKTTTFGWVAIYTPHGHFRLIFQGFSSIFVVTSFSWSSTVTFGYLTRKLTP